MTRRRKPGPLVESAERVAAVLQSFDYAVDPEDFVFYELHRMIEEDRASFDDADFRALIDAGIHAHIEDNIDLRARLAGLLRSTDFDVDARTVAMRVVRAVEDLGSDLRHVAALVRSYTGYLLRRLETIEPNPSEERVTAAADLLFEATGDRDAARRALDTLCEIRSPVSARILAHAVSEPLLDEDLEAKAFTALKAAWPLPRHYMLYNLQGHAHEDIPYRWFQLFVEVDELTTVELVLEELRVHGGNPRHREDLAALLDVLQGCRDPELEDKILGAVNGPDTKPEILPLLQDFLRAYSPSKSPGDNPWTRRERQLDLNRQYLAAAALFDAGRNDEALKALDRILTAAPDYPFATMLRRIGSS